MRLPFLTEIVLALGRRPLELLVLPIVGIIAALIVRVVTSFTEGGRRVWAHWVYAFPIVGTLIRSARLAAFADLLAILVEYEVPLPEAFQLAGKASSEPIMATTALAVHQQLSQGRPLGEVLRGRGLVPEWVSWMVGLGERRGTLAQTLRQVAGVYRRQAEMRAALLRQRSPPVHDHRHGWCLRRDLCRIGSAAACQVDRGSEQVKGHSGVPLPTMKPLGKFLTILSLGFVAVVFLGAIGLAIVLNGWWPGFMGFLLLGLIYGWMVLAFLHYRLGRQDEFLQLLIAAVEADAPLCQPFGRIWKIGRKVRTASSGSASCFFSSFQAITGSGTSNMPSIAGCLNSPGFSKTGSRCTTPSRHRRE